MFVGFCQLLAEKLFVMFVKQSEAMIQLRGYCIPRCHMVYWLHRKERSIHVSLESIL